MTPRKASAVLIVILAALGPAAPGEPIPAAERGFRGFLAVRGERVVAAENPGRLFTPASVLKLVVVATALHHLGPDHRVTTRLRARGEVTAGTLEGDLVVEAAGDPTWSRRFFAGDPRAPLAELARQLRGRGVTRVAGDLVIDTRRFPGRPHPLSRPLSELAYGFAAPAAALAVDDNTVEVEIAPGDRPGQPGTVRLVTGGDSLTVAGRIRTVSRERHGKGTVDVQPVWGSSTILVAGEYPVSEPPYRIPVAVPAGEIYAGRVLAAVLQRHGIDIEGRVRVSAERTGVPGSGVPGSGLPEVATGPVVARIESPPIAALLEPILTESSNWHAEMLLLLLAAEVLGEGRYDEALELERSFLTGGVGLAADSFALDDASGLSPYNLLSPEAVVGLLRYVRRQSWGQVMLAALARPGHGTLEVWRGLPAVAAKTGMIRHTVALAGYLDSGAAAGEPLIFVCFANHRLGDRGRVRREIAELVQDWQGRRGS